MLVSPEAWAGIAAAAATFLLALITLRLAVQGRSSNEHAERLYQLQLLEIERTEARSRPNLQLFDFRLESGSNPSSFVDMQLTIDVMNFGNRPARIKNATLRIGERIDEAKPRSTACVRHGEVASFAMSAAIRKYVTGIFNDSVRAQAAGWPEPKTFTDGELVITYSEVDGSDEQTGTFSVPIMSYRGGMRPEFMFTVQPAAPRTSSS